MHAGQLVTYLISMLCEAQPSQGPGMCASGLGVMQAYVALVRFMLACTQFTCLQVQTVLP